MANRRLCHLRYGPAFSSALRPVVKLRADMSCYSEGGHLNVGRNAGQVDRLAMTQFGLEADV
jgi:hypothetical protein